MLVKFFFLLTALVALAFADVQFVTPSAGNSVAGGGKSLSVTWKESGVKPPISSFTTYTLFLCAGGNEFESQVRYQRHNKAGDRGERPIKAYQYLKRLDTSSPRRSRHIQCWEYGLRNRGPYLRRDCDECLVRDTSITVGTDC